MMRNRHWVWQGGLLMILLVNRIAHGDLYTHGVLSLEWLVDSSDEIHLVRYRPSESEPGGGLVAEPLRTLKPESGQTALTEDRLRDLLQPTGTGKPDSGEWILFIRLMDDDQPRIVQGIDLERPMASFRSAAITRDGTPIKERHGILSWGTPGVS